MLIHNKSQMNEPKMRAVRQCGKRRKGRKLSRAQDKDFLPSSSPTLLSIILWVTSMAVSMAVQRCTLTPPLLLVQGSLYIHHLAE